MISYKITFREVGSADPFTLWSRCPNPQTVSEEIKYLNTKGDYHIKVYRVTEVLLTDNCE